MRSVSYYLRCLLLAGLAVGLVIPPAWAAEGCACRAAAESTETDASNSCCAAHDASTDVAEATGCSCRGCCTEQDASSCLPNPESRAPHPDPCCQGDLSDCGCWHSAPQPKRQEQVVPPLSDVPAALPLVAILEPPNFTSLHRPTWAEPCSSHANRLQALLCVWVI